MRELENDDRSPEAHALGAVGCCRRTTNSSRSTDCETICSPNTRHCGWKRCASLAQQTDPSVSSCWPRSAGDESQSDELRAEAIVGLAPAAEKQQKSAGTIGRGQSTGTAREAERVLRLAQSATGTGRNQIRRPTIWPRGTKLLERAGRRGGRPPVVFQLVGPRCGVCHQHNGRGGRIGPDLTHVGRSTSRERIIASILQPEPGSCPALSAVAAGDRRRQNALGLRHAPKAATTAPRSTSTRPASDSRLPSNTIEVREAASTSIMPDGLESTVSIADLRDLVTFLTSSESSQ